MQQQKAIQMPLNFIIESKKQPINPKSYFICLNPLCSSKNERFMSSKFPKSMDLHKQCMKWAVPLIQESMNQYRINCDVFKMFSQQDSSQNENNINLKLQPLPSIRKLKNLFEEVIFIENGTTPYESRDPFSILQNQFLQIKNRIENDLKNVFNQIYERIRSIKFLQSHVAQQLNTFFEYKVNSASQMKNLTQKITESKCLQQYDKFIKQFGSLTLFNQQKAEREVKIISESISRLKKCFWIGENLSVLKEKEQLQATVESIYDFYENPSQNPTVSVANLKGLFSVGNISQVKKSQDKTFLISTCWICNQQLVNSSGKNLQQKRLLLSQDLLAHIKYSHKQQTQTLILQRALKTTRNKVTYQDFIEQIEEKPYEEFIIVDRQNLGKYPHLPYLKNSCTFFFYTDYILSVLSAQNENLAAGKYILAHSNFKDSADTLIIMLVYEIVNSLLYKPLKLMKQQHLSFNQSKSKPFITILTKDHFATTLVDIIKQQYGDSVQIRTLEWFQK